MLRDNQDRILVLYRDTFETIGITVVHGLPNEVVPQRLPWTSFELTTENMGTHP